MGSAFLDEAIRLHLLAVCDAQGPQRLLYFYHLADGSCPATEFLEGQKPGIQANYYTVFRMFGQDGRLRGEKHHVWGGHDALAHFKNIGSKTRMVHTTDTGGLVILLFGITGKKEDKLDKVEVNRAERMRDEYRRRRDEVVAAMQKKKPKS